MIDISPTLSFVRQIGLIFLMFMAGLEVRFSTFKELGSSVGLVTFLNGAIPFFVGFGVGQYFEMDFTASMLLGIIFMSSSIAVVIPSMESLGFMYTKLGRTTIASVMLEDIVSLFLFSIVLQTIDPITTLPLLIFYLLLLVVLVVLRVLLPKAQFFFLHDALSRKESFEREVRIVFAILVGTVVLFELLGLHPMMAAFFVGLVLSDSIKSDKLYEKFHTMSYGFFILVFFVFVIVGITTDISVFVSGRQELFLVLVVVFGSIIAKFGSGYVAGRVTHFSNTESVMLSVSTIPQLSTILAVVFIAREFELVPPELIVAMVILSMVTTFAAPLALKFVQIVPAKRILDK